MNFYERYALCCKKMGIQPASQYAADQIGCSKAAITSFAKTGNAPKGEIVAGAAKMLNVSADYLLGLIDEPVPINNSLSQDEAEFLSIIRDLNEDGLEAAEAMLYGLHTNPIYKKGGKPETVDKKA